MAQQTALEPVAEGGSLLATTAFAVALAGAAVWWWFAQQPVDPASGATARVAPGMPELHLAVMVDITLLALALGALLGFGAAWLLRPLSLQTPCGAPAGTGDDSAQRALAAIFDATTDFVVQTSEEMRLRRLVLLDPLTGLLNRSGFDQALSELAGSPGGHEASVALLYVDLDRFKLVNDAHGHPVGDELLKIFAKRLKNSVRPGDTVARLGGDEFAIVLMGLRDASRAQRVAAKVVRAARMPFWIDGRSIHVGASVGIALSQPGLDEWGTLVERADAMLYRAKADGHGRHAMDEA